MAMFQIEVLAGYVRKAHANVEFAQRRVRETQELLNAATDAAAVAQKELEEATRQLLEAAMGMRDPFEDFKRART